MRKDLRGNESELIQKILSGDFKAEKELFEQLNIVDKVNIMIRTRVVACEEDYRDLAGEVLISIVMNLRGGKFDPQKGSLDSYMWGIVKNKIRNFLKTKANKTNSSSVSDNIPVFDDFSLIKKEMKQLLKGIIPKLEKKYQQVILLRYYRELSIEDIADILNLTPTQVYNRIHYALTLMRNCLSQARVKRYFEND